MLQEEFEDLERLCDELPLVCLVKDWIGIGRDLPHAREIILITSIERSYRAHLQAISLERGISLSFSLPLCFWKWAPVIASLRSQPDGIRSPLG